MIFVAIDPGPEKCGVTILRREGPELLEAFTGPWFDALEALDTHEGEAVVCEAITPQKTFGNSTIETCYVIGGVREWCRREGIPFYLVPRMDVRRTLLGTASGSDAVIVQELQRRGWVKGTKRAPGRAYGVSGHSWQALALAIAWLEMQGVAKEVQHAPLDRTGPRSVRP